MLTLLTSFDYFINMGLFWNNENSAKKNTWQSTFEQGWESSNGVFMTFNFDFSIVTYQVFDGKFHLWDKRCMKPRLVSNKKY